MNLTDSPLLKNIVESAPIGICILNARDLMTEIVNEKYLEITGKKREAVMGKWHWEPFPEARAHYEAALNGVVTSSKPYHAEEVKVMLVRHGKEEWIYTSFVYAPVFDEGGNISKVAVWVLEKTAEVQEREKVTEVRVAVERERDRMYEFFNRAPAGICVLNGADLIYELVNPHYQALLPGRSLLGRPFFEAVPELVGTDIAKRIIEVYETGKEASFHELPVGVALVEHGPTEERYFTFTFMPRFDTDGKVNGLFNFVFEVTGMVLSKQKAQHAISNLELMMNMLPASMVVIRGYDLIVEMINDKNLEYWNRSRNEVVGRPFLEILPDLADQPFAGQLRKVMETGEIIDVKESPVLFTSADGSIRETYVDYTYQPLYDSDGHRDGVLVMSFEITDRVLSRRLLEKYANEITAVNNNLSISNSKLAKSEARFKFLIQEAPVAIGVLHGKDLVVETANQKLLEVWGKQATVIGLPLIEALPELIGQPFPDILQNVLSSGKPFFANEIGVLLEHGGTLKELFFNLVYQPFKGLDGRTGDILIVAMDVTEQVNARNQVERSEQHFRKLADLVPAKISNARPGGEVTFFNKQWLDFAGMDFENLRDFGYHQLMHPEELPAFQAGLAKAAESGVPFASEIRLKNTDGKYIWHLNVASPVLDEDGKITMWVGSTTDIQALKEEEQRKSDFVSMLSHELKTPITSIKGYVQLLLRMLAKEENSEIATKVSPSLSRIDVLLVHLTGLISDMLDLSRIDAGRMDLKIEPLQIDSLVKEVVEDFRLSHQQYFFQLDAATGATINADRNRLSQVLVNLIANAVKYSPQSSVVDVSAQVAGKELLLSVKDYGIGIEEKDHQKIFERFIRVEGQNEKYFSGFGIGLFLVQNIVARHGGHITLQSAKNKGSVFTVHLPL